MNQQEFEELNTRINNIENALSELFDMMQHYDQGFDSRFLNAVGEIQKNFESLTAKG
jgi:chromosome segregation ATPase